MPERDGEENPFVKALRDARGYDAEGREPSGEEPWEFDPFEGPREALRIFFAYGSFIGQILDGNTQGLSDAQIEDIVSSMTRVRENFRRFDEWMRDRAAAAPDGGDPRADWMIAFRALPVAPEEVMEPWFPEAERLDALWRVLGRMGGRPIYRKRWIEYEGAILAELANLESWRPAKRGIDANVDDRAKAAGWRAGRELTKELTPAEIAKQEDELLKKLRKAVQKLVFDDIVGPTYRRRDGREVDLDARPKSPETIYADPAFASRMLDRDELRYFLEAAGLTDGERDVFELDRRGLDTEEIAERLDTTPGAVYTRRNAWKKKLEAIAREIDA